MISVWGLTDKGIVRRENQDSCAYEVVKDHYAWGVVCDGMGGAKAGDIASKMAVDIFKAQMAQVKDTKHRLLKEGDFLIQAAEEANRVIYRRSETDPECFGMGTTLVGVIFHRNQVNIINVGDSRAYHITGEKMQQITRDHSVVEDMVENGDLTPEQARQHPQKNLITRALGTAKKVQPDLFQLRMKEGDYLLLCSDGLVNEVTDKEIQQEIRSGDEPKDICQRLMEKTLANGAPDNVTVVLFKL